VNVIVKIQWQYNDNAGSCHILNASNNGDTNMEKIHVKFVFEKKALPLVNNQYYFAVSEIAKHQIKVLNVSFTLNVKALEDPTRISAILLTKQLEVEMIAATDSLTRVFTLLLFKKTCFLVCRDD
jgi:hypothetical protein